MPHDQDGDNQHETRQRVRLQRVLAAAGIAARRACEELIEDGHVAVNGKTVNRLPAFVDPETDRITVDGRLVSRPQRPVYVMLNKPARVLATTVDETSVNGKGRTTIMDLIDHPQRPRLFPVGRLDYETTGLVLLTNDGALANRLSHPKYGVPRTYQAIIKGVLDEVGLASLQRAMIKEQRRDDKRVQRETGRIRKSPAGLGRIELSIVGREPDRTVVNITLREGRTGNIAKMLSAAGANVKKLERISVGPLLLTGVAPAQWRELERHEVKALKAAARGKLDRSRMQPADVAKKRPGPRQTRRPTRALPQASAPAPEPAPIDRREQTREPGLPRRKPRTIQ